jgi:hypothetical protein
VEQAQWSMSDRIWAATPAAAFVHPTRILYKSALGCSINSNWPKATRLL